MALADKVGPRTLSPKDLIAFVADQQTQGYGVAANSKWISPLGNLYVTFVFSVPTDQVMTMAFHFP
jgi:biotin-(acetyl-CoA carboxylase) ligase